MYRCSKHQTVFECERESVASEQLPDADLVLSYLRMRETDTASATPAQQQLAIERTQYLGGCTPFDVVRYVFLLVNVSTTAGGIVVAVVIAAVVAVTVLETKAPGPETLQSVSNKHSLTLLPRLNKQCGQICCRVIVSCGQQHQDTPALMRDRGYMDAFWDLVHLLWTQHGSSLAVEPTAIVGSSGSSRVFWATYFHKRSTPQSFL